MKRPSAPRIGLNVPHRADAATLPRSRKSGHAIGVGWRGRKPPPESAGVARYLPGLAFGTVTLAVVVIFVAALIDPKAVRRPPELLGAVLIGLVMFGFLAWIGWFVIGAVRERRRLRSAMVVRREKNAGGDSSRGPLTCSESGGSGDGESTR